MLELGVGFAEQRCRWRERGNGRSTAVGTACIGAKKIDATGALSARSTSAVGRARKPRPVAQRSSSKRGSRRRARRTTDQNVAGIMTHPVRAKRKSRCCVQRTMGSNSIAQRAPLVGQPCFFPRRTSASIPRKTEEAVKPRSKAKIDETSQGAPQLSTPPRRLGKPARCRGERRRRRPPHPSRL